MAGHRAKWTQTRLDHYLKEGRGQGHGKDYHPWLRVEDVSSKGRSTTKLGWKTKRDHHLLSDGETRLFYIFEWSDKVHDIREQFPLLDLDLAFKVAEEMGISYPHCQSTNTPYILTTDFMLSVKHEDKIAEIARTFKLAKDLEKKSVIKKLELERRYYSAQGIDWGILTEREVPRQLAKNIQWIHSAYYLESRFELTTKDLQLLLPHLKEKLKKSNAKVNQLTSTMDQEMNLEPGTSIYLFRHLIARKEILFDMQNTKSPTSIFTSEIKLMI